MSKVEFGDLFRFIRNGMNVRQDKSGNGLPITRIETISDGTVDGTRVGYAALEESDCDDWLLEPGDILFSHINSVEQIGKCAVYRGEPAKLVHGMNLLCLRCNKDRLYPEFAKYLIGGIEFRTRLSSFINKAVNQASVSIGNLKTIPVSVPPMPEQQRIADVLDRADALRGKRRTALAQLNTLTQAIFLDMFGDSVKSPKAWAMMPLRELVTEFRYGTSKKSQENGFPTLRIPNVVSGGIETTELKLVPVEPVEFDRLRLVDGDLLFVRTNGNPDFVGRCAVFDSSVVAASGFPCDEFIFASYLIRTRLDKEFVTPLFVREFMLGDEGRRKLRSRSKTSAGQFNINTENLGTIAVPVPPLDLQYELADRIGEVGQMKTTYRASLAKLNALFACLQHHAFRGEL